jgi:organic hydroperoxide reductase OsmC/OhrA
VEAESLSSSEQPKVKHKSFTYTTGLTWIEGKVGSLVSDAKPPIQISSPPEFRGLAGYWTPEDLFVGAVEMCQMLTFIALVQKQQLPLVSYKSTAKGTLEFIDGQYRFTHIVIVPTVIVEEPASETDVRVLLREAHKRCLIANSITAVVEVNANIIVQEPVAGGEVP